MQTINLSHLINKLMLVLVGLFLSGFVLAASFRKAGGKTQIWIEAEDAESVHAPLKVIEMKDASKGKGVIADGNHFITEGYAKYSFTVPEDGEYILWARCFWMTLCTNSFTVSCDNSFPEVIGEDPLTNEWHWVLGCRFKLKRGKHEMILWNREQFSQVDKYLLTADASYIPTGTGTSNAISEDFEENSIPESFSFSNKDRWEIANEADRLNKSLFLKASEGHETENETSLIRAENPENYLYCVAYRCPDAVHGNVLINFNYASEGDYYYASLQGDSIDIFSEKKGVAVRIGHKVCTSPVLSGNYQDFSVERRDGVFRIRNNGVLVFAIPTPSLAGTGLGIGSASGNIYFDNIVTRPGGSAIDYTESLHSDGFHVVKDKPEVDPQYLENLKRGCTNWWAIKGKWDEPVFDGFESVKGRADPGMDASVVFGGDTWRNYDLQVAFRSGEESGVGVVFNFQDSNNYDIYKWKMEGVKWKHQLIKRVDGKELILAEKPAIPLKKGTVNWYKLDLRTKDDSVKVYLDDELSLFAVNGELKGEGKAGFWTNSTGGVDFDDIKVSSIRDLRPDIPLTRLEYDLYRPQERIAISYADWVPSGDQIFGLDYEGHDAFSCITKGLFEEPFIQNKKTFAGNPRIETSTNPLERDVDANYELSLYSKGIKSVYRLTVAADSIYILKDAREVFSTAIPMTDRGSIAVSKTAHDWQIRVDSNTFRFPDEIAADSVRVAIGYTGIGKAKIDLAEIIIDNPQNRIPK